MQPEFIDPTLSSSVRLFLAFVLGRSLIGKLRAPGAFRDTVRDYELLPARSVPLAATVIAVAEALVTIGLLLPDAYAAGAIGAMTLFIIYSAAIAVNLARGRREIDCGCSGPLARGAGIHEWLVARNAFYLLLAGLAAIPVATRSLGWLDALTVAFATSVLAVLALAIDGLAASAARTRLEPTR